LHRDRKTIEAAGLNRPPSPELARLFEDILNRGLSLRIKVTGRSMMPFLTGGEILTIKKVSSASLKKGDLLFFKNSDGLPVLHRIVRKKRVENVFIFQTKGDALSEFDEPVPDSCVLGKACKIENTCVEYIRQINLESLFWLTINYLTAIKSLVRSSARFAALRLLGR
jgi:signal peptidase I